MENNNYTNTVYQNELIYTDDINNYKLIKTKDTVKAGELLLIEHVFNDTSNICQLVIQENEYLHNELYPRITLWDENNENERNKNARSKFLCNCFGKNGETFMFGNIISKINHSCNPNSILFLSGKTILHELELIVVYYTLLSIKDINKGDEVTITYGVKRGHDNGDHFECHCNKSIDERRKVWNIIDNISSHFQRVENNKSQNIIITYEETSESLKIMMHQYLAKKGYIVSNNGRSCVVPRFIDFVNEIIKEGSLNEKVNSFLEQTENNLHRYKRNVRRSAD